MRNSIKEDNSKAANQAAFLRTKKAATSVVAAFLLFQNTIFDGHTVLLCVT